MSGWVLAGWAAAVLVVVTPVYWLACMLWPFTACRHCEGSGRRRSPSGKNWGRCRWCKGRGEKLRIGRRLINWAGMARDKLVG